MQTIVLHTKFAPAERSTPSETELQTQRFLDISPALRPILDAVPEILMTLNADRQIIFANRSLKVYLGRDEESVRGLRPGEVLDCVHAHEEEGGCGTSESCSVCGAVKAILVSQAGQPNTQDCRVTRGDDGEALDLRVSATPFDLDGERYTLFALADISHEKRRQALERVFFHDVLNTVTALKAAADIMVGKKDVEDLPEVTQELVGRLTDEIVAQRQLVDAEDNELVVNPALVDVPGLLQSIAGTYARHTVGRGRTIRLELPESAINLVSDTHLLRRVLGNMLKNALEASPPGETVTFGSRARPDEVEFWVHNPAHMPRDVQLQVFQRSFSTRGAGRGLGTYSMKLLTERYLKGCVSFSTGPDEGTTFVARYPLKMAA